MIRQLRSALLLLLLSFLCTGCASIFGSPFHDVAINSTPENASYTITNEQGELVASGTTPDTVELRSAANVFRPARYYVNYEFDGYVPQEKSVKGKLSIWYFGNIFGASLIGFFIIDPFTGALFDLPNESNAVLQARS